MCEGAVLCEYDCLVHIVVLDRQRSAGLCVQEIPLLILSITPKIFLKYFPGRSEYFTKRRVYDYD